MINRFREFEGTRKAGFLSLISVLAILAATLWPFNPFPENRVEWLPGTSGLKIRNGSVVVTDQDLQIPRNDSSQSYTLELLLRPATIRDAGPLLTFYVPGRARQLQLRQWRDGLLVTHDASVESDKTRTIKFDVGHVFHPGKLVFIAISSGEIGTTVYVEGQLAQSVPTFKIRSSELSGRIVLGTSPRRYDAWRGEVKGIAVYARQLTPADASQHYRNWTDTTVRQPPDLNSAIARYPFTEAAGRVTHNEVSAGPNLTIPTLFRVPDKFFLESPAREFKASWKYVEEVTTNIAGFVPLGLIVCSYLVWRTTRSRAIIWATFFCGVLSFAIEVAQYYIPRRGSGVTDIITNTIGAALGATLLQSDLVSTLLLQFGLIPPNQNRR